MELYSHEGLCRRWLQHRLALLYILPVWFSFFFSSCNDMFMSMGITQALFPTGGCINLKALYLICIFECVCVCVCVLVCVCVCVCVWTVCKLLQAYISNFTHRPSALYPDQHFFFSHFLSTLLNTVRHKLNQHTKFIFSLREKANTTKPHKPDKQVLPP